MVLGFKALPSGGKGPAEETGRIERGGVLVAVNGIYITQMAFDDVITLLQTQRSPFIHLPFLRCAYTEKENDCDIVDQYFKDKNTVHRVPLPVHEVPIPVNEVSSEVQMVPLPVQVVRIIDHQHG